MNVLIVGAGKTGRRLALALSGRGYDVAVVDRDQSRLDLLGENFDGITVAGVPVDRDVLISAGCENADVACVITPEDNVNVMVTQLLRTDFQVETIYTRILDPSREAVFHKFGLHTICATRYEADHLLALITKEDAQFSMLHFGSASVSFEEVRTDRHDWGLKPSQLYHRKNEMPFAVRRKGGRLFLTNAENLILSEGDSVIFAQIND